MATEPLIKVSCVSKGEKIGLTNYSDLIVFDKDKTIVALRIGGYPEAVQAMSDILIAGCDLELQGARETIKANTKGPKTYERKLQKINALQMKKKTYEEILQRQLEDLNSDYAMLQMQGQELAVRNVKGQTQIKLAA